MDLVPGPKSRRGQVHPGQAPRDKPSGFVPNPTNGPRSLDPRQGQSP